MRILIGADVVPTQSNEVYFREGNARHLLGDKLFDILQTADCRIFNLEVPITDTLSPIAKCGPNLIASTSTIQGYIAFGTDVLTLANNHIMDQEEQGLASTIRQLKENNIEYLGVGEDPAEAAIPYVFECEGKKIGIYACTEHEFSVVTAHTPGANPFDPLETPDHIMTLKDRCDYVIVLYHGGKEHYRYPSPELQRRCRKLAEKGADLILCQHTHCIGCEEVYHNSRIVYGQGNFLFDHSASEFWQTSLLVQIDDGFRVSYIPLVKHDETVRLAEGEKAKKILKDFEDRSIAIQQSGKVEELYSLFSKEMLEEYLLKISGKKSFVYRAINKLTGNKLNKFVMGSKYTRKALLAVLNCLDCESHRELFTMGIQSKIRAAKEDVEWKENN